MYLKGSIPLNELLNVFISLTPGTNIGGGLGTPVLFVLGLP